ncbi:signal transduction histidine kinase [Methanobacterium lacus]|uniref:Signal transduction histidine kinase n=1 Tax=Methanobacterium lacus (strain AL-21) TaxID=877455 RepID=F0T842_METLA|nr:PAS domain S-box protein [Methanobacterium lacus]ADZ09668.1 signal transduction histidine kinase [Methanobacterium lacus]
MGTDDYNDLSDVETNFEWQQIFDSLQDMIAIIGLDFKIKKVNKVMLDTLGVKSEDLVGKECYSMMHCSGEPPALCPHAKMVQDGTAHQVEFPIELLKGDYSVSAYPICDKDGNLTGSIHIVHSVTERNELSNINRYLASIVESSADAIYGKDLDDNVISWNKAAESMYGYPREEMMGKSIFVLIPPNKKAEYYELMDKINHGEAITNHDTQRIKKNGELIDVALYISPMYDSKGNINGSATIAHDIHERKLMEKTLKESEEKYREVFRNANDMISLNHMEKDGCPGKFIDVNQIGLEMYGYSYDEFLDMTALDIVAPEDRVKMDLNAKNLKLMGYDAFEITTITKSGKRIPIEINNHTFQLNKKEVIIAVGRDVTERKKAEKALVESENRYRSLFENMLEGFLLAKVVVNNEQEPVDWMHIAVNQGFKTITELDDVVGKNVTDILPYLKDENPELFEIFGRVAQTGVNETFETYMRFIEKWLNITAFSPKKDYFVVVFEDITERKNSELALIQSEEKFREVFNNANDAMFLQKVTKKGPGKFIEVNDTASQSLGYSKEELVKMELKDIISSDTVLYLPTVFENVIRDGKATFESEHVTKKGDLLPVEVNTHLFFIRGEKHLLSIARDISERKKAEKALIVSEEKYRTIFENIQDVFFQTDQHGILKTLSPSIERYSGYKPEDIIGKPADIFYADPHERKLLIKEIENRGHVEDHELIFKTKENKLINVSINAQVMRNSRNEPVGIEGSIRDITERKQMEIKLKKSLNEKEMLLKEIHHRVKNNLMIISSLLSLQTDYIKDKASKNIFIESQNRARSMALIHEKLYQSTDLKSINFGEYIKNLTSELFYTYRVGNSGVDIHYNIEDLKLDINTAIPLGLIANELITNSLKYAFVNGGDGVVIIEFKKVDHNYIFMIKDNGVGLPEGFDYKNSDSLGLQLVNNLSEQIDAEIELNTTDGTEFKIKFKEIELA